MINIELFKNFLGYGKPGISAVYARGSLTLNRKTGVAGIISIPPNLTFSVSGKFYESVTGRNPREINESQDFVPYLVQATFPGVSGNLSQLNQTFNINQDVDFTATNEGAITGGAEEIAPVAGASLADFEEAGLTDERLQEALDVGTAIVKSMSGNDDADLTDNILIKEAVYLVAMYRLQNNTITEKSTTLGSEELSGTVNRFFRDRSFIPLMGQVESLISQSGKRNLTPFFGDIQ